MTQTSNALENAFLFMMSPDKCFRQQDCWRQNKNRLRLIQHFTCCLQNCESVLTRAVVPVL